jgi:arylsulfatase A-like enzyme
VANTPFRRHKTWLHEGGISTPLIVHWPRGISAAGELRHNVGHVIDLVPTLLDVAGGERLKTWRGEPIPLPPGKSLRGVFVADVSVTRDCLWWRHEGNRAIRVGDWKLVAAGEQAPWELYDLSIDRSESHNLAADQPERVQALGRLWNERQDEFRELLPGQRRFGGLGG